MHNKVEASPKLIQEECYCNLQEYEQIIKIKKAHELVKFIEQYQDLSQKIWDPPSSIPVSNVIQ